VAQGSDDAMYFANNHYLLRYDGVKWEKICCLTIIRSIYVVDDKIYSAPIKNLDSQIWEDELCVAFERKSGFDDSENEEIWKILNLRILFISSLLMLFTSTTAVELKLKYRFLFLIVIPLTMKF
jgi:sucrose-6-phosphate hydrolase SacC (GH32 family)